MQKVLPGQRSSKDGQVVLIVLLIMSVILVVGLSIASRSVTDIKISQQSQEAARALWVAQGGLEEAIKTNSAVGVGASLGGVNYSVTKTGIGGAAEFVFPGNFGPDEPATLWLVGHNEDTREIDDSIYYTGNRLTFYWGNNSTCDVSSPALEATLIYKNASNRSQNKRYVYDCFSAGRTPQTNFSHPNTGCSLSGQSFAFCSGAENLNLPANSKPYLVRLRLIFNNTSQPVGVGGNANFPPQGSCFYSLATVPESGVSRKLKQCQLWSTTPSIFDSLLWSGSDI